MNPSDLIAELALRLKLSDFALNENGLACLGVDETLEIHFENDQERNRLQVYSILGSVPAEGKEALFRQLLEGNLFGIETRNAILGIDDVTEEIVLSLALDCEKVGVDEFERIVSHFVATVEDWRRRLESSAGGAQEAGTGGENSGSGSAGLPPAGEGIRA